MQQISISNTGCFKFQKQSFQNSEGKAVLPTYNSVSKFQLGTKASHFLNVQEIRMFITSISFLKQILGSGVGIGIMGLAVYTAWTIRSYCIAQGTIFNIP